MDEYRVRHAARLMLAAELAGITIEYDADTNRLSMTGPIQMVKTFHVTMSKHHCEILHLLQHCELTAEKAINRVQALARVTTKLRGV